VRLDEGRGRQVRGAEERRQAGRGLRAGERARVPFGRFSAVLGIAVVPATGELGPARFVGIVRGALGHVLGARRLGTAALWRFRREVLVEFAP
jgi:hypothetical protein